MASARSAVIDYERSELPVPAATAELGTMNRPLFAGG